MSEDHISVSDTPIVYDPLDNSEYDVYFEGLKNRPDFAKDAQDFEQKRKEFVEDRLKYWEDKIDDAFEEFSKNPDFQTKRPTAVVKQNAARLLSHAELGVKLVYNKYNPEDAEQYPDIKFHDTSADIAQEGLFSYLHIPDSRWKAMILIHLGELLKIAEDPSLWYDDFKQKGGHIGPVDLRTIEDNFLFGTIEEAAHNIYITHSDYSLLDSERPKMADEFYYAEDAEFQALKVQYLFAKKYTPEYASMYKDHMVKMVMHRKSLKNSRT